MKLEINSEIETLENAILKITNRKDIRNKINEKTMHGFFILGLVIYGLFLTYAMKKEKHQSFKIVNTADMADMPPIIELRKENQIFVTYK
jgi:hypothetical protein